MTFYTGKRVLVAGGTGTVGMSLVLELQRRGANVIVVSMDSEAYARSVLPEGIPFFKADLTDEYNCLCFTSKCDVVFDMMGIKGSTLTNPRNYSKMFTSYLSFQTALMAAAARKNVQTYLFAGSVCSYPQMDTPKSECNMWDGLPIQNDKYVGLIKRIGEMQATSYYEDGSWSGARIIRLSNVYGAGDDYNVETAQVISALIAKAVDNSHVKVHGDGTAIRDFIYVDDAAYWACEAAEKLPPCVPVNIASGKGVSVKEVCTIIQEFLQVDFEFMPDSYSGDRVRVLSVDRAKELLSFYERTNIRNGIRKSIEWYKEHKDVTAMKGRFYGRE